MTPPLDPTLELMALEALEADTFGPAELIQPLWSNYGALLRVPVHGGRVDSAILKLVDAPTPRHHPRGWQSSLGHERKLRSYAIERHWYTTYAARAGAGARVPLCFGAFDLDGPQLLVLEDLDAAGFSERAGSLDLAGIRRCLDWLAQFHATFIAVTPDGLWPVGTYWHLATRPDEWTAMPAGDLRTAAAWLDAQLTACPLQTLVHGDAKLANFCFSTDRRDVAAVDFQYVGGGCGMKDVAYFLGSCLNERDLSVYADELLDSYFLSLRGALTLAEPGLADRVEAAWRPLYALAWVDFNRFLHGWMPGHHKLTPYSLGLEEMVLAQWRAAGAPTDPG